MKLVKTLLLMVLVAFVTIGCSKEDENRCEIMNLSGVDWYDIKVLLLDSDENIEDIESVGNVSIGDTFTVSFGYSYFYISGKNFSGSSVRSYNLKLYNGVKVTGDDMMLK